MKFLRSLFIHCLIIAAVVHFGSNFLISYFFQTWLEVPVSTRYVRWGLSSHHLVIKNIALLNPAGYPGKNLARIASLQADYDITQLAQGIFKIKQLELDISEIHLEKKSLTGINLLELAPLRHVAKASSTPPQKGPPIIFQIEKTHLKIGKVFFQTQLGNGQVSESRPIERSENELNIRATPDSVLFYTVGLALQAAGLQGLLPSRQAVEQQVQSSLNDWIDELKKKAQGTQGQITQMMSEKLKQQKE